MADMPAPGVIAARMLGWLDDQVLRESPERPALNGPSPIPIQERITNDLYRLDALLPGFDPEHEIHIKMRDGRLLITAVRPQPSNNDQYSEFQFGTFRRVVILPEGSIESSARARYTRGVLSIDIDLHDHERETRSIEIDEQ